MDPERWGYGNDNETIDFTPKIFMTSAYAASLFSAVIIPNEISSCSFFSASPDLVLALLHPGVSTMTNFNFSSKAEEGYRWDRFILISIVSTSGGLLSFAPRDF